VDYSIRNVLDQVANGQIRVPAFQRGFIWDSDRVAYLMDSIYKSYPFGSLLFWRTSDRLTYERQLGPFKLPPLDEKYPVHYVLDGQQRLTSVFAVFQNELDRPPDSDWKDIYFDLDAPDDVQDSQFIALEASDVDSGRHFPLRVLFDSLLYRQATEHLDADKTARVDRLQEVFKEARIPVQMLDTDDRTRVAIVFERVNRLGVELDTLQLLTAWTWSDDFDLQRRFVELGEELEDYGFSAVGDDTDLVLRCCAAVVPGDSSARSLIALNGAAVRESFERVAVGIKGAIDFVNKEMHVEGLRNLPYPAMLVPLSVFFASEPNRQPKHNDDAMTKVRQWFWRVCFSRRYSSQTVKQSQADVEQMALLREGKPSRLGSFNYDIAARFFTESQFRMASANTKSFILLLAQQTPLSFLSANKVNLREALLSYNRSEFHHMFPKSYLRDQGVSDSETNSLANFCLLTRTDNNRISNKPPSEYRAMMPTGHKLAEVMRAAFAPDSLFNDDFNVFVSERAELLKQRAVELMG
jgi:hypothetical protein